jgi:hypothetical protein
LLDRHDPQVIPKIFNQSGFRETEMLRQALAGDIIIFQLGNYLLYGMGAPGKEGIRPGGLFGRRRGKRRRRQGQDQRE